MDKRFLELKKEFDENGDVTVILSLDTELIRKGMLKNLTPAQLKILLAIASHMDDNGIAFPSMRYLSEITGVAVNTVSTAVKGLLDLRIDGVPVMTRIVEGTGARKKSKYNFVVDTDNPVVVDETQEVRQTAKYFILLFCEEYEKEFGRKYAVSWMKESGQMKNLMKKFSDKEIKTIIHITVTEFAKRWRTPTYPSLTLGAVCGWMANQALQIADDKGKKQTKASKWDHIENTEEDLML